jgi:hypothetical protein
VARRPAPRDLHEWISFEDPHEDRTWVFDATFLASPWTCIYGAGCRGVLHEDTTELQHGCCSHGAHLLDEEDEARLLDAAARLTPDGWEHFAAAAAAGVVEDGDDGARVTRRVDGACIFLNRPGFATGAGCALHQQALVHGERPMDWKPEVCWQLPLRLQEHIEEDGHVTSMLREWKRRDWGDAGSSFHWWCTDDPAAFVGREPAYVTLRDEITAFTGEEVYALLAAELRRRTGSAAFLPHPQVRRRPAR